MKTYDLMIVDDSERARQAIRKILTAEPLFRVIAEAESGSEAVSLARDLRPDLILMDINMPGFDGLQATGQIKQELPSVRVVILSVSDDPADLFEAIRSGAQGYLVKSIEPNDWIHYLHGILDDQAPISNKMAERLIAEFSKRSMAQRADEGTVSSLLTARESEILELVRLGATNRQVSQQLYISENTVKNHLKHIMAKLQMKNRVQLATYVASKGQTHTSSGQRKDLKDE